MKSLLLPMLCAVGLAAHAATPLASCYNDSQLPAPASAAPTEIFVVVDQTTLFDQRLRQSVASNLKAFLQPGNTFTIIRFSAYTQGQYTEVLASGRLDPLIAVGVRNSISKPVLARFDRCVAAQPGRAAQVAGVALRGAFGGASTTIAKSDVIASLYDISSRVRRSGAQRKVVLIASDMLENSSLTSFYANQAVRTLSPEKELALVGRQHLFADFGRAEIYVIGAGLLADERRSQAAYRSPQTIQALAGFWREYFRRSHAELVDFGQPALLNPLH